MLAGFSFTEGRFPVGVPLSKEFRRREPLPFPLGSLASSLDRSTLISPRALTFCCPLQTISSVFSFALGLAAPEAGFSSCLSREEKYFSRFVAPSTGPPCSKFGLV